MAQRQKKDIYLYQGDDKSFRFTLTSGGVAYNLAGATTVKLHVKQYITDSSILFSESATDGVNGNVWASGVIVITISDTNSLKLTGDGVYDLEIIKSSITTSPCYGIVYLQKQVGTAT
jgi:hypothetical protein